MDIDEYKRNAVNADLLGQVAGSPDARTIPSMLHQILLEQRRIADAMSTMAGIEVAREADRKRAKRQHTRDSAATEEHRNAIECGGW